jgi:hypothetical protein
MRTQREPNVDKIFVATGNISDYDSSSTWVIAVSADRQKLEEVIAHDEAKIVERNTLMAEAREVFKAFYDSLNIPFPQKYQYRFKDEFRALWKIELDKFLASKGTDASEFKNDLTYYGHFYIEEVPDYQIEEVDYLA